MLKGNPVGQPGIETYGSKILSLATRVIVKGISVWEKSVGSWWRNHHRAKVTYQADKLTISRTSTVGNALAIQKDVTSWILQGKQYRGVLFVTASAYVEPSRLISWVHDRNALMVVGGSHALDGLADSGMFLSGFCQYFSWDVLQLIDQSRDFDHSVPNDVAITRWLVDRRIPWEDPGIAWFAESVEDGTCPLCEDASICIVRCTTHGERWRESAKMKALNHHHE
jgi:hypothetical protein